MGWEIQSPERVDVPLWRNSPNQPGIIFLELGLCWASPGLSCSVSAYETTSAHLCHSTATGPPPSPSSSHLPPFPPVLPLLHCFKCKINIKLHSCTVFRPVSAECSSGLLGALRALVLLTRPCSMQEWFSWFKSICPMFGEEKGRVNAFQIVFIWGLILSHLLAELKVFTLCPILYVWCF